MGIHLENISTDLELVKVDPDGTLDQDLVQLAGYHSYNYYPVGKITIANGKRFEVIDTRYDNSTGLDALTIQNTKTDEISIVYVGSDQLVGDWINTNIDPIILPYLPPSISLTRQKELHPLILIHLYTYLSL